MLASTGALGTIARDCINTALLTIAQDTRASIFEAYIQADLDDTDYLQPISLPSNILQIFTVSLRVPSFDIYGDSLLPLEYLPLDSLEGHFGYSLVGSSLYISPSVPRPHVLQLKVLIAPTFTAADASDSGLPDLLLPTVQHTAAAILALSYLDDANQASIQQKLAERGINSLRSQYGHTRGKSYNISGSRFTPPIPFNLEAYNMKYALIDSPTFTGNPKSPTPVYGDNDTSIATTEFVQAYRPNAPVVLIQPGTLVIPNNSWTTIVGAAVLSDSTGAYNTSTGNFTVPATGIYCVCGMFQYNASVTYTGLRFLTNGGPPAYEFGTITGSGLIAANGSVIFPATAGQNLTIQTIQTSGVSNTISTNSHLAIFRVSG